MPGRARPTRGHPRPAAAAIPLPESKGARRRERCRPARAGLATAQVACRRRRHRAVTATDRANSATGVVRNARRSFGRGGTRAERRSWRYSRCERRAAASGGARSLVQALRAYTLRGTPLVQQVLRFLQLASLACDLTRRETDRAREQRPGDR